MATNWQIFSVRDLSGGVNRSPSEFLQGQDEMRMAINWGLKEIGALKKDGGYLRRGSDVESVTTVLGLTPFYYGSGQKQIAVLGKAASADAYVYNPSTDAWAAQGLSLTAGAKAEFSNYLDGVFMTNYSDSPRWFDGSTWSTSTNLTNAPKARYCQRYFNRMYFANLDVSGTAHPSRVALSSLPDESYHITWDMSEGYFDVSPKDGSPITGLGENYHRLLIYKENGIWRYDTNSLYVFPGAVGTTSQRSIANVLGWTIAYHPSGIYGVMEDEVVKLSRAVDDIIAGVLSSNVYNICAGAIDDVYYIYLGDVLNSSAGIDIKNCVLKLDVAKMKWTVGSFSHTPLIFAPYRYDRTNITYNNASYSYNSPGVFYNGVGFAQEEMYFGDNTGKIYRFSKEATTFAGEPIAASFETPNYYFAGQHRRGILQAIRFYVKQGRRLKLFYSLDDGPWLPVEKYKREKNQLFFTFKSDTVANRVKIKGIDNGVGEPATILGYDFFYTPLTQLI